MKRQRRTQIVSRLRWFRRCAEWRPRAEIGLVPKGTRGLYTLLRECPRGRFDVVYVGIAFGATEGGVQSRLQAHAKSRRKGKVWSHFSIFEVWPNVSTPDLRELEGLLRHLYRKDTQANRLNQLRGFGPLFSVRNNDLAQWTGGDQHGA